MNSTVEVDNGVGREPIDPSFNYDNHHHKPNRNICIYMARGGGYGREGPAYYNKLRNLAALDRYFYKFFISSKKGDIFNRNENK